MIKKSIYLLGLFVVSSQINMSVAADDSLYEPKDIAISADSQYVATVEFRSKTKAWDYKSKKSLWTHQSKGGGRMTTGANSVDISRDGTKVVYGDNYDEQVVVLDTLTGKVLNTFHLADEKKSVYAVKFSPDGNMLAASGATLIVWDLNDNAKKFEVDGHKGSVRAIDFSPDSKLLVSGSWDATVKLWDTETGQLKKTFTGHSDDVRDVAFSNSGKWIASGADDRTFIIWDVSTGELLKRVKAHTGGSFPSVNKVLFTPDDKVLITGGDDRKIMLWNSQTGDLVGSPYTPKGCVRGMDISESGDTVVVASASCTTSDDELSFQFVESFSLCCSSASYEHELETAFKQATSANSLDEYYAFLERHDNEFNENFPERMKVVDAARELYAKKVKSENVNMIADIKEYTKGERYVPTVTNTFYSSEDQSYYLNGEYVHKSTPTTTEVTSGGYSENVTGYDLVFAIDNDSDEPRIITVEGTWTGAEFYFEKVKDECLSRFFGCLKWSYKNVRKEREGKRKFAQKFIAGPGGRVKHRFYLGEKKPGDLKYHISHLSTLEESIFDKYKFVNSDSGMDDLATSRVYFTDLYSSTTLGSFSVSLAERMREIEQHHKDIYNEENRELIHVTSTFEKKFDPDFENTVYVELIAEGKPQKVTLATPSESKELIIDQKVSGWELLDYCFFCDYSSKVKLEGIKGMSKSSIADAIKVEYVYDPLDTWTIPSE